MDFWNQNPLGQDRWSAGFILAICLVVAGKYAVLAFRDDPAKSEMNIYGWAMYLGVCLLIAVTLMNTRSDLFKALLIVMIFGQVLMGLRQLLIIGLSLQYFLLYAQLFTWVCASVLSGRMFMLAGRSSHVASNCPSSGG